MTIQGWRLPLFRRSLGSNLRQAYRTMGDAAQTVAAPRPVLAVFFCFLAIGVFLFGLYELQRVITTSDEVRILRAALAVLSFGFAVALVYEDRARSLASHRRH